MRSSRRRGWRSLALAIAAALGLAVIAGVAAPRPARAQAEAQQPAVQWRNVERVITFADVHGAYAELLALLRESGVVDQGDRWAAGTTHVVSLGDLLSRGAESRRVMDLLMRLQVEARAAGGRLHVVLGNHEAMSLLGDLRYVHIGEYASYADLESAAERAEQRRRWESAPGAASAPAFDQKFPPGYFGHRAALSVTGRYGRWLLSLPVAITINDTLFMHAGPSRLLLGIGLMELNLRYRTALAEYLALAERLAQARLLQPGDEFHLRVRLARERMATLATAASAASMAAGAAPDAALGSDLARLQAAEDHALLSTDGPNWYRGAALCPEVAEADVLLPVLQQYGVSRLVVGHTPTRDARAVTRFDGRVIKLDAGMNRAVYKGRAVALFLQADKAWLRYAGETEVAPLRAEGLFVAPQEIADERVRSVLADGDVSVTGPRAPDELQVSVEHAGQRVAAVFQVREADAARHEVAAYRLDRQLGLGIVPVTVERTVQGRRGVLQARPLRWHTLADVQRQSLRRGGWCDAESQHQLVYAFDTLIGNERRGETLLFDADTWNVYATRHDAAFGRSRALPEYLRARPPVAGAELRRRLGALNEAALLSSLGDLIDARDRQALLQRRDLLLALPGAAATRSAN